MPPYWGEAKERRLARRRELYAANPEKYLGNTRRWRSANPNRVKGLRKKYRDLDPEAARQRCEQWREDNYTKMICGTAKKRAKERGWDFKLTPEDIVIPEFCPVFGVKLVRGTRKHNPDSPSIDRIDSSKGYVKGNIWVISRRANVIKNDASVEELERLAAAVRQKMTE